MKFSLWIENEKISENDYNLIISSKEWVFKNIDNTKNIQLFDPVGSSKKVLNYLGIKVNDIENLDFIEGDLLIVANVDKLSSTPDKWNKIIEFSKNGGKVLMIHPGEHILSLLPEKIESILDKPGRIVNMHIPESEAFKGINPLELSWFQPSTDKYPTACRRSYRLKGNTSEEKLCTYVEVHSYLGGDRNEKLKEMSGVPLMELEIGKGKIVVSEMEVNIGWKDPISGKLLINLVEMLVNE